MTDVQVGTQCTWLIRVVHLVAKVNRSTWSPGLRCTARESIAVVIAITSSSRFLVGSNNFEITKTIWCVFVTPNVGLAFVTIDVTAANTPSTLTLAIIRFHKVSVKV